MMKKTTMANSIQKNSYQWLLLLTLIICSNQLTLPILPGQTRCMVIYTIEENQNLKLHLDFQELPNQTTDEVYQLTLTNTEDNTQTRDTIASGSYKEQLILKPSIVYRLCIKLFSRRRLEVPLQIDYNADLDHISGTAADIKIPENLLTVDDLATTYRQAERLYGRTSQFLEIQKGRVEMEDQLFMQITSSTSKLISVSMMELVVIVLVGLYQFWSIRKFLVDKQYM